MPLLANIAISALIGLATFVGAYKYMPLNWIDSAPVERSGVYGSTITTILGTDTLSSSRSVINTNFANLNADKIEATQTTLNSLTSASSLATIGTITSGTWNGTTIGVPYGGTGSTTLTQYSVLLGSSTNALFAVPGTGSSGQTLTSNGPGTWPTWQSGTFDQTQNYSLTGGWNFAGTYTGIKALTSSSTININNGGSNVAYSFPTSHGANNTVLTENGSGSLSWALPVVAHYNYATTTSISTGGSAVFAATTTIPASTMTASSSMRITAGYTCDASAAAGSRTCTITATANGVTLATFNSSPAAGHTRNGTVTIRVFNNSSLSSQSGTYTVTEADSSPNAATVLNGSVSTSINTANSVGLSFNISASGGTSVTATLNNFQTETLAF